MSKEEAIKLIYLGEMDEALDGYANEKLKQFILESHNSTLPTPPEDNKQGIDPFYQKMFDECYNTGVEHCIEAVKNYSTSVLAGNYSENSKIVIINSSQEIIEQLEQLKKSTQ